MIVILGALHWTAYAENIYRNPRNVGVKPATHLHLGIDIAIFRVKNVSTMKVIGP